MIVTFYWTAIGQGMVFESSTSNSSAKNQELTLLETKQIALETGAIVKVQEDIRFGLSAEMKNKLFH